MSFKSFVIALVLVFIIYEVISVILGVYKKKKQAKEISNESEVIDNVSSENENER